MLTNSIIHAAPQKYAAIRQNLTLEAWQNPAKSPFLHHLNDRTQAAATKWQTAYYSRVPRNCHSGTPECGTPCMSLFVTLADPRGASQDRQATKILSTPA